MTQIKTCAVLRQAVVVRTAQLLRICSGAVEILAVDQLLNRVGLLNKVFFACTAIQDSYAIDSIYSPSSNCFSKFNHKSKVLIK